MQEKLQEMMIGRSDKAKGKRTISKRFEIVESKLTGPYSTGEGFTAVDPLLPVFYRSGNGIDVPKACPSYTVFAQRLAQRASVAATLADQMPRMDSPTHTVLSTKENVS